MATKKVYDLAVVVGSYTDNQGANKNKYQNVGAVLEKDDGRKFILLERWFNPAGVEARPGQSSIILSLFEPKDHNQGHAQTQPKARTQHAAQPQAQAQPAAGGLDFDDDIPF